MNYTNRGLVFVGIAIGFLSVSRQSGAGTIYTAGIGDQGISHSGSGLQSAEFQYGPVNGISWQEYASAGPGGLGASTHLLISRTVISGGGGISTLGVGAANAYFALDDIIISGPTSTVNTSLNLSLSGTLAANTSITGPSNSISAAADVYVQGSLTGLLPFTGEMNASSTSSTQTGTSTAFTATGVFSGASGYPGSISWTTASGNLAVGTPLSFNLLLETTSILGVQVSSIPLDQYGESTADFLHTLSFSKSGPVFNLPEGYTVNSVSGNIVDNHFVSATPEPSTLTMLLSGLGIGVIWWRRTKQRGKTKGFLTGIRG